MNKYFFIFLVLAALNFSCNKQGKNNNNGIDTANVENIEMPVDDLEPITPEDKNASIPSSETKNMRGHELTVASFPNLKVISPAGYENVFIFYDPEHSQIINAREKEKDSEPVVTVLKTRLDDKEKEIYTITFSPGMSDDPLFTIKKGDKEINSFTALELVLPGNGSIYTSGHTNNMFDERRKYQLKDGKIKEAKQAFLYVGIKSKTNGPFQIFSDLNYSKPIATLPKGTEVEVLVNQGKNYLIRTPFGITGWWKYDGGHSTPIDGLTYAGD